MSDESKVLAIAVGQEWPRLEAFNVSAVEPRTRSVRGLLLVCIVITFMVFRILEGDQGGLGFVVELVGDVVIGALGWAIGRYSSR